MYDSKEGNTGLYLAVNGQSVWLPKPAAPVELIEAAGTESFEEGEAYRDDAGCVFLRRYDNPFEPWIDADGDTYDEDWPARPLVQLTEPASV